MAPGVAMADEFALIERFFSSRSEPGDGVWLGVGDDAAVLDVPPHRMVVEEMTCHRVPPGSEGFAFGAFAIRDALARSRAAGAQARWFLLALTLPEPDDVWLEGFSRAIRDAEHCHRVRLVGGDTTQGPASLSVCVLSVLPEVRHEEGDSAGDGSRTGTGSP